MMVFGQGEPARALVMVQQGDVALGTRGDEGSFRTERHVHGPSWLDLSAGWPGETHALDARAMTLTTIVEWSREALWSVVEHHPALARRLILSLAREARSLAANSHELMHKDAPGRLAAWLNGHCHPVADAPGQGVVQLPMRKRDIASQLAITPETLSRLMRSFTGPAEATRWACVRDKVTGLIWEVKTDDGGLRDMHNTYTIYGDGRSGDASELVATVNAAGLCGANDWRLPSRLMLHSLVDYGIDGYVVEAQPMPEGVGRFQANADEVTDTLTGLIWRRCSENQSWTGSTCGGTATLMVWELALDTAAGAAGGGVRWRLPDVKELASLLEDHMNVEIDSEAFPHTRRHCYWSSTHQASHPRGAWYVSFKGGHVSHMLRGNRCAVRLVRTAQ
jgi:CRP-like cAMP-binding protein